MTLVWQAVRAHLGGIRTGERLHDRLKIALLIVLRLLVPWWALLRRFGIVLPSPLGLVGWYRLRDQYGVWDIHGSGGPAWLTLHFANDGVATVLDSLESGTLIDVGASCGYFAVRAARRLGNFGRVVAIEAHPMRHEELNRSVALNGLNNVLPIWCAAGDHDGEVILYQPSFSIGRTDPSVINGIGQATTVPQRSIDSLCDEVGIRDVRLVKIDVEGFEASVLRGMAELVHRDHPAVIFEALDAYRLAECSAILRKHGYCITPVTWADYLATPTCAAQSSDAAR